LLGSDTSCCDLLQPGLPRIPALPYPDKPCSYQDDQVQSYASGRPGLYNGCVVCRVVLSRPGLTTRPSLCALLCVAQDLDWCNHDYPRWDGHNSSDSMLQHPPCARYTGFYHGVGAPTGPPLGAPILRIAPYRCPKPSLALTPAAVGLMYAYTNNRGRAVGADLAGAIRVLSGRGYADFHAGANFAITEFSEVHGYKRGADMRYTGTDKPC
jgi:hypothetical protein